MRPTVAFPLTFMNLLSHRAGYVAIRPEFAHAREL
jgi:hypothetical protein